MRSPASTSSGRSGTDGLCLHDFARQGMVVSPDAPAVVVDGRNEGARRVLTHRTLHRRAGKLARRLRAEGVGPDTLVAVAGLSSPEVVVALLGVLRAGGAFLALDPGDPPERLRVILDDARPTLLLADPGVAQQLPGMRSDLRVLPIGGFGPEDSGPEDPGREPLPRSDANTLAYVMYTSGSSGRPKGVLVEHRSIVNRIRWAQEEFDLGTDDVVLHRTPLAFDVSVTEIFWPLAAGARLLIPEAHGHRDPAYLADLVEREGVTVLHFVPSMLAAFLEVDGVGEKCRSVRHVLAGGEALAGDLVRRFHRRMPESAELHNLYGPTEATVAATHWRASRDFVARSAPIGRPISNVEARLYDPEGQPAAEGEAGELWIAGVQVARGYLNRPELTAQRFVTLHDAGEISRRCYRTGDRARWNEDGTLEFLGRSDRQVKVRGVRVELAEVEAALLRVTGVREAVATLREDTPGEPRLVGYVVLDGRGEPDPTVHEIRSALARELPEAMVPSTVVELPALPVGATEKLERTRLPAPAKARPTLADGYVPPRDELESFLAGLWARVLDLDRVGIHDRFFELGGSSLQAARIVNEVASRLETPVYVVTIFDAPTVAEYASLLRREYAGALARRFPIEAKGRGRGITPSGPALSEGSRVDEAAVARFRSAIPRWLDGGSTRDGAERNPPALFILAPPRSGTTLLRVMLAGHSGFFAAPELHLLNFRSLGQRRTVYSGRHSLWLEGSVRTLMELRDLNPAEAWEALEVHETAGLTTHGFFRLLQGWAAPRLVVDKSPAYALDPAVLRRAEEDFQDPLYIHLVRHPWTTVRSFRKQRLEQLLVLEEHDLSPSQVAELVWLESHANIHEFLDEVPEERQIRIRFEDMVRRPEESMRALCERFGLPFEAELADPYQTLEGKMVDGVHPESTPMGDRELLLKGRIDPSVAFRDHEHMIPGALGSLTWTLAERLGYQIPLGDLPAGGFITPGKDDSRAAERARLRRERLTELGPRRGSVGGSRGTGAG